MRVISKSGWAISFLIFALCQRNLPEIRELMQNELRRHLLVEAVSKQRTRLRKKGQAAIIEN